MLETLAIAAKDSHRELRAPQPEFIFDPETIEGIAADRRSIEQQAPREVPERKPEPSADPSEPRSLRSRLLGQIAS